MISLTDSIVIDAPKEKCFKLLNDVECQAFVWQSIDGTPVEGKITGQLKPGDETTWTAKLFGLLFKMELVASAVTQNESLVMTQTDGPFKHFQQVFSVAGLSDNQCRIDYALTCESPAGPFGLLYESLLLEGRWAKSMTTRLELVKYLAETQNAHQFLPNVSYASETVNPAAEKPIEAVY